MNTWNYRVIKSQDPIEGATFKIHEVYYDQSGEIEMWTERPVVLEEGSMESLETTLKYMLDATRKPPLEEASIDGKIRLVPVSSSTPDQDLPSHISDDM
ncbi:hypothetical protein [Stutzerimonas chloritidismutans]|uniref:Uncharacterized protein n=1 Tax=Stutzerimonas chloritidismutans TaxID=203192 RepID=A0ABU9MEE4_STUCH